MSRKKTQATPDYVLSEQVGFILRKASQRHASIFAEMMIDGVTPTRFAALAKLYEIGPLPQNELGRQTAMDVATIKGVVDRLCERGLTKTSSDPNDGRRLLVELTAAGQEIVNDAMLRGVEITRQTLAPLSASERTQLVALLKKIT